MRTTSFGSCRRFRGPSYLYHFILALNFVVLSPSSGFLNTYRCSWPIRASSNASFTGFCPMMKASMLFRMEWRVF